MRREEVVTSKLEGGRESDLETKARTVPLVTFVAAFSLATSFAPLRNPRGLPISLRLDVSCVSISSPGPQPSACS